MGRKVWYGIHFSKDWNSNANVYKAEANGMGILGLRVEVESEVCILGGLKE